MPQAWQGALCCGPITDTGRCSPPSLLAGHNGLVAVSTESGVLPLLHPQGTAGDWEGSALWVAVSMGLRLPQALPSEGGTTGCSG